LNNISNLISGESGSTPTRFWAPWQAFLHWLNTFLEQTAWKLSIQFMDGVARIFSLSTNIFATDNLEVDRPFVDT